MGKIEQIKLARKMIKEERRQGDELKQYRNKVFIGGFASGALVAVVLTSAFFASRGKYQNPANTLNLPPISTGSATFAPDITLPTNLQLPQASPTPIL